MYGAICKSHFSVKSSPKYMKFLKTFISISIKHLLKLEINISLFTTIKMDYFTLFYSFLKKLVGRKFQFTSDYRNAASLNSTLCTVF